MVGVGAVVGAAVQRGHFFGHSENKPDALFCFRPSRTNLFSAELPHRAPTSGRGGSSAFVFFSHLPVETHTLTSVETLLTAAETQHRPTWFNLTVIQGNLQDSESV